MHQLLRTTKQTLATWYYEKGLSSLPMEFSAYGKAMMWWKKEPNTKFIVFAQGRSGSTLLVNLLNGSDRIFCDGEVFGAQVNRKVLLPHLFIRTRPKGLSCYGCRIKIYDLTWYQDMKFEQAKQLIRNLNREGWKIIYLKRHNLFRQSLSSLVAEARGLYHFKTPEEKLNSKLIINGESLPERIAQHEEFLRQEREVLKDLDFCEVSYEDDLLPPDQHQRTLNRVLDYLHQPSAVAKTTYVRTSSDDPSEYIANYSEVIAYVKGTPYEHFLYE